MGRKFINGLTLMIHFQSMRLSIQLPQDKWVKWKENKLSPSLCDVGQQSMKNMIDKIHGFNLSTCI